MIELPSAPVRAASDGIYSPTSAAPVTFASASETAGGAESTAMETGKVYGLKALAFINSKAQLAPFRMPAELFGLGAVKPFSIPSASDLAVRLKLNLPYYSTNYAALYLALCAMSIITSPTALICLTVTAGGWILLLKTASNPEAEGVSIGSLTVKKQVAFVVMGIVSVFAGLTLLGTLLGWSLWLSAFVATAHAAARDATALADAAEANANRLEGDIEPFLNA
ncbi:PRA1 family protein-domain-containing protein [Tribonema minus]|uniref:PRA1 family protein n=1 Tax=Tribonema minus TaxID=303371 RepID=A0A835ZHS5_9STRA|nr:PRA1 family protein-domain-containing protein [Tribonema minus]